MATNRDWSTGHIELPNASDVALGGHVSGGTNPAWSVTADGTLVASSTKVTGKNGASPRANAGRLTTTGAPTTGTWAVDDIIRDSAGADWRCTVAGTPGTWVLDSGPYAPAASAASKSDRKTRTSGDITLSSTASFADADTGLDIVLAASSGQKIVYGITGGLQSQAVETYMDVATIVSAAPVNYISGLDGSATTRGIRAWQGSSGINANLGGSILYTLVAGDISAGTVTLRLRYRNSSATTKTLVANTNEPLTVWAMVVG